MLAHGLRNSARLAIRPGTNDVWLGDWGGGYWEEINRVPQPTDPIRNFGWPCYEGGLDAGGVPYARVRPRSDDQELAICEGLYARGQRDHARRTGPTTTSSRSCPARTARSTRARTSRAARSGASRSIPQAATSPPPTAARCSSGTSCASACGRCCPAPTGCRSASRVVPFAQAAAEPARHRGRAGRRPALDRRRRLEREAHPLDRQRGEPGADGSRGGRRGDGQPAR